MKVKDEIKEKDKFAGYNILVDVKNEIDVREAIYLYAYARNKVFTTEELDSLSTLLIKNLVYGSTCRGHRRSNFIQI